MVRRLYWQDSYGSIHRDRDAERVRHTRGPRGSGGGLSKVLTLLAVLAVIMVIASTVVH